MTIFRFLWSRLERTTNGGQLVAGIVCWEKSLLCTWREIFFVSRSTFSMAILSRSARVSFWNVNKKDLQLPSELFIFWWSVTEWFGVQLRVLHSSFYRRKSSTISPSIVFSVQSWRFDAILGIATTWHSYSLKELCHAILAFFKWKLINNDEFCLPRTK